MKLLRLCVFAFMPLLLLAACNDDDPIENATSTSLTLNTKALMGAEGQVALESNTYSSPQVAEGFRMSRISYYISDVRLVQTVDGQDLETDLIDVAYVEVGPDGLAANTIQNVPTGSYDKLRFRMGLTTEQDATTPADYSADHPLGRDSEYWVDWGSYIFYKLEGKSDTLADFTPRFDVAFTYHVGKAATLAREIELDMPMELSSANNTINLNFDVSRALGIGLADGVKLAGGIDHRNNGALPIMERSSTAFSVAQ